MARNHRRTRSHSVPFLHNKPPAHTPRSKALRANKEHLRYSTPTYQSDTPSYLSIQPTSPPGNAAQTASNAPPNSCLDRAATLIARTPGPLPPPPWPPPPPPPPPPCRSALRLPRNEDSRKAAGGQLIPTDVSLLSTSTNTAEYGGPKASPHPIPSSSPATPAPAPGGGTGGGCATTSAAWVDDGGDAAGGSEAGRAALSDGGVQAAAAAAAVPAGAEAAAALTKASPSATTTWRDSRFQCGTRDRRGRGVRDILEQVWGVGEGADRFSVCPPRLARRTRMATYYSQSIFELWAWSPTPQAARRSTT